MAEQHDKKFDQITKDPGIYTIVYIDSANARYECNNLFISIQDGGRAFIIDENRKNISQTEIDQLIGQFNDIGSTYVEQIFAKEIYNFPTKFLYYKIADQSVPQQAKKQETIQRMREPTTRSRITINIGNNFGKLGIGDQFTIDDAALSSTSNLSLTLAKKMVIQKCRDSPSVLNESVYPYYEKTWPSHKVKWSIRGWDEGITAGAVLSEKKDGQEESSFDDYGVDESGEEPILYADGKPVITISTRPDVDKLNDDVIIALFNSAVESKKGTKEISIIKSGLLAPNAIKEILDSQGFDSLICKSIEHGFAFENMVAIVNSLDSLIPEIVNKTSGTGISPFKFLKFYIGFNLINVYSLNSSDILGGYNCIRYIRDCDKLPCVGFVSITKSGGAQAGLDNYVFLFSIVLENIYFTREQTSSVYWGDGEEFNNFFKFCTDLKQKLIASSGTIDLPPIESIAGIINKINNNQTLTPIEMRVIYILVTDVVDFFLRYQDNIDNFIESIKRLYGNRDEMAVGTHEIFTPLSFIMHRYMKALNFWPEDFEDLPDDASQEDLKRYFTTLIEKFKQIYRDNLGKYKEESQKSRWLIFLYETFGGHDLLWNLATDWGTELYPDVLGWLRHFRNDKGQYNWGAVHAQVVLNVQRDTYCQGCICSAENGGENYTIWSLTSSLVDDSVLKREIKVVDRQHGQRNFRKLVIPFPRGQPTYPTLYKYIKIIDGLPFKILINYDLQKYLSVNELTETNQQYFDKLEQLGILSAIKNGVDREVTLKDRRENDSFLSQIVPITSGVDEASNVNSPNAIHEVGTERFDFGGVVPFSVTYAIGIVEDEVVDFSNRLFRLDATPQISSLETYLSTQEPLLENEKNLLKFLKSVDSDEKATIKALGFSPTKTEYNYFLYECLKKERLYELINQILFLQGNPPLDIEDPASIDTLINFMYAHGTQNLIPYVLEIIRSSGPVKSVAGKKGNKKGNKKGVDNKIAKISAILERLHQTPAIPMGLNIYDFAMFYASIHVVEMAIETSLFLGRVERMPDGRIRFVDVSEEDLINFLKTYLNKIPMDRQLEFAETINGLYGGSLQAQLEPLLLENQALQKRVDIAEAEREEYRQTAEAYRQTAEAQRIRAERAEAAAKRAAEAANIEFGWNIFDEENFVGMNPEEQQAVLDADYSLLASILGSDNESDNESDSINEKMEVTLEKKLQKEIQELPPIPDGEFNNGQFVLDNSIGGGGAPVQRSNNVGPLGMAVLEDISFQHTTAKRGRDPIDEMAGEPNEPDESLAKRIQSEEEKNKTKTAEQANTSDDGKMEQSGGSGNELKDGDIILGKQNPDGTITYIHLSKFIENIFGITNEGLEIEPKLSALGLPIKERPTEYNIGDWVSQEKGSSLSSRFHLVPFVQNGINGYKLEEKRETGIKSPNFSYSEPRQGEEVYTTSSSNTNTPVSVGGRKTRRYKNKTYKRKTRKHRKIKYKKYTRPYNQANGKRSRKGRNNKFRK
jgi:hypothetical protein